MTRTTWMGCCLLAAAAALHCSNAGVSGLSGQVGDPCASNEGCISAICASHLDGPLLCRESCESGCPAAQTCEPMVGADGVPVSACASAPQLPTGLCAPCSKHEDCTSASPGTRCLPSPTGGYCSIPCVDECEDGFACVALRTVGLVGDDTFCIPVSRNCACLPSSAGESFPCEVKNQFGTCKGVALCNGNSLEQCSAPVPELEVCNGLDDDCNGKIDDLLLECGVDQCRTTIAACEAGASVTCPAITVEPESCNEKDDDCDGAIDDGFDKKSDALNCGACGTQCPVVVPRGRGVCANGVCSAICEPGRGNCDGLVGNGCEADLLNSQNDCGGCGKSCSKLPKSSSGVCEQGACRIVKCPAGFEDVDGDPSNGCEAICSIMLGQDVCETSGRRRDNDCDGLTDEDAGLDSDIKNCGRCGNVCPAVSNGKTACTAGRCTVGACAFSNRDCDEVFANGCETNTSTSIAHCGACGAACTPPNAVPQCVSGKCGIQACAPGWADCDGQVANGCEVNLNSSRSNCGGCGLVCPTRASAVTGCSGGRCAVIGCMIHREDCDGSFANGCEANTTSSPQHCGGCGNACVPRPNAHPTCNASTCGYACDPGFADCNGDANDGCEVALGSDIRNCGGCGHICPFPAGKNTSPICRGGVCNVQCSGTFGECNANSADGCETNLVSAQSCGQCGQSCRQAPNMTSVCEAAPAGTTPLASCKNSCASGFADCNKLPSDGCEADLQALTTCGTCATNCERQVQAVYSRTCLSTGKCDYTPDAQGRTCYSNCRDADRNRENGCEAAILPVERLGPPGTSPPNNCADSRFLGTIDADENYGPSLYVTGNGEGVFRFDLTHTWIPSAKHLRAKVSVYGFGNEYELYYYAGNTLDGNCSKRTATPAPFITPNTVSFCFPPVPAVLEKHVIWVEVVRKSGNACWGGWSLRVDPNFYDANFCPWE